MPAARRGSAYAAVLALAALAPRGSAAAPRRAPAAAARARRPPPAVVEVRIDRPLGARDGRSAPGGSASRASDASCWSRRCTATSRTPAGSSRACATADRSAASTCGSSRPTTPTGSPGGTRRNARGVDLNRNFPHDCGRPRRQLRVRPAPGERAGDAGGDGVPRGGRPAPGDQLPPAAQRRRHRHQGRRASPGGWRVRCGCPRTSLDCGGLCHGTMTMWFNPRFRGAGAHRRVRRPPLAAPDGRPGAAAAARRARRPPHAPRLTGPAQRPWKTGFSLAMNASTAARWSSVPPVSAIFSASKASDSSQRVRGGVRHRLADRAERDGRARRPAGRRARRRPAASSSAVTTWVASPSSRASCGRDGAREVEQLHRLGPADEAGQRPARPGVAGERDAGEGGVEAGRVDEDPEVGGEGQARPGAGRDAVDRRDDRLGHRREGQHDRVVVLLDGVRQRDARPRPAARRGAP